MSKHTPGPWKVVPPTQEQLALNYKCYSVDPSVSCGHGICSTYREANAHLIAAAPEMLEALLQAQTALESLGRDETPIYAIICNAIAKATGGDK